MELLNKDVLFFSFFFLVDIQNPLELIYSKYSDMKFKNPFNSELEGSYGKL